MIKNIKLITVEPLRALLILKVIKQPDPKYYSEFTIL